MPAYQNATLVAGSRGRLRIALPALYRSRATQRAVETALGRRHGVGAVYANPLTGRVLILFDPALPAETLLAEFGLRGAPAAPAPALPVARGRRARPDAAPAAGAPTTQPDYPPWHLRDADAAVAALGSSRRLGLSRQAVEARLRRGRNLLTAPPAVSTLAILLKQFNNLPVMLLGLAATVSAATGALAESLAIGAVLAVNGGIGFATERRAEAGIASLAELSDPSVPVLRAGAVEQIDLAEVVPGDVLLLSPGIRVAADARLLQAERLAIDESALTGESLPLPKHSAALARPAPLAERANMAYRGTVVAAGSGRALVVGTGDNTEVGAIQALTGGTRRPPTPIQRQLDQLGNQLVKAGGAICLGIFGLGLLRGQPWLRMLKTAISLAIAALPEGLPAVATTALARGIVRMRAQQVLIRRLQAVETIGAIQTICLDKTGTLTLNRMSAVALQTASQALRIEGGPAGWPAPPSEAAAAELARLLRICVLCNLSRRDAAAPDAALNGTATENALIELAARAGVASEPLRRRFPMLKMEERGEGRNYMRSLHATPDGRHGLIAVKGSPLEVLDLCRRRLAGARALELDPAARAAIARQNQHMAQQQLRVLGFACAQVPRAALDDARAPDLTWVGLVGLADPLRPGVARVIAAFHAAGIRTVMLTGDQAATAYVIGQSLHLNNGNALHIVNSEHLDRIAQDRLPALAERADIFSRVSPSHKLQIVRALRQRGQHIAMTGDGINDGPALRAADVGIAMGGGTDVARSVADVVLKDDRLDTLLEAVRQGRTIALNIRKALHFLLSSNLSEILAVLGFVALGRGQPLTPMQLLWLNLLSDMLPALALVAEPAEDDVMSRPPRDPRQPIVGGPAARRYAREGAGLAGGALASYLYGLMRHGQGPRAGTVAFNALVLGQLLHAWSCRSERHSPLFERGFAPNRQLTLAIGASAALQLLANLLPGLRRLLGIERSDLADIVATLAGAGIPLLINEAAKGTRAPE